MRIFGCLLLAAITFSTDPLVSTVDAQQLTAGGKPGTQLQLRNLNAVIRTVGQKLPGETEKRVPRDGFMTPVRWCPAGKGVHGNPLSTADSADDGPVKAEISRGFWIAQHEVTRREWQLVMSSAPWEELNTPWTKPEGENLPAIGVTFAEAQQFCSRLTKIEREEERLPDGWEYRLPTEAEWEHACRAGTSSLFSFGDDRTQLSEYAWTSGNCLFPDGYHAHEVETKLPNAWGIHDMHGNTWEWCVDWYSPKRPGGTDPVNNEESSMRVRRGGGWQFPPECATSGNRDGRAPSFRSDNQGFRFVVGPNQ